MEIIAQADRFKLTRGGSRFRLGVYRRVRTKARLLGAIRECK